MLDFLKCLFCVVEKRLVKRVININVSLILDTNNDPCVLNFKELEVEKPHLWRDTILTRKKTGLIKRLTRETIQKVTYSGKFLISQGQLRNEESNIQEQIPIIFNAPNTSTDPQQKAEPEIETVSDDCEEDQMTKALEAPTKSFQSLVSNRVGQRRVTISTPSPSSLWNFRGTSSRSPSRAGTQSSLSPPLKHDLLNSPIPALTSAQSVNQPSRPNRAGHRKKGSQVFHHGFREMLSAQISLKKSKSDDAMDYIAAIIQEKRNQNLSAFAQTLIRAASYKDIVAKTVEKQLWRRVSKHLIPDRLRPVRCNVLDQYTVPDSADQKKQRVLSSSQSTRLLPQRSYDSKLLPQRSYSKLNKYMTEKVARSLQQSPDCSQVALSPNSSALGNTDNCSVLSGQQTTADWTSGKRRRKIRIRSRAGKYSAYNSPVILNRKFKYLKRKK